MSDPFNRDPTVEYGRAVRLAPQVRRLTVKNPSPMTFTGTQTYLVGTGEVAVIDPGPRLPEHTGAILAALDPGERITAILLTHTHLDHSPGAALLKDETGAPTYAFGPHGEGMSETMRRLVASGAEFGGGEGADRRFAPDRRLEDGESLKVGDVDLVAHHTPGHLSNHLAFAMGDSLFTGDLIMGWATTMVSPPDGDMAAFMASLDWLSGREDAVYYPGHGHAVEATADMVAHQKAHRRARLEQILDHLGEMKAADPIKLTTAIYHDVDPRLHGAAARNVFAALLGLVDQGRVEVEGDIHPEARFRLV